MAAPVDNSRIFMPVPPSLLHLAAVRVSSALCNNFSKKALEAAIWTVEGGLFDFYKNSQTPSGIECQRAQDSLLSIPAHLRKSVFEAVYGLKYAAQRWQLDHEDILEVQDGACIFYYKSDGRINALQTARQLVLNANIDIRKRFILACVYCLEECIQNLWTEMELYGETENLETACHPMVNFWIKRIRGGSRVPWREAAREFFSDPEKVFRDLQNWYFYSKFSYFFTSLNLDARNLYLFELELSEADADDFLVCMYAITKKEGDEILKRNPLILLEALLQWPWQRLFHKTAEKLLNYMSESDFCSLICIFGRKRFRRDFDYCKLFCDLWNRSPIPLREKAKQMPLSSEEIDWWFNATRKQREEMRIARFLEQKSIIQTQNER